MKIVAVDVDGVVADLHGEWLRRYNDDYGDTLRPQDIRDWNIHKLVKEACGNKIFDYLRDPDLYDKVAPVIGARVGVEWIRRRGNRVIFISSCVLGSCDQKYAWLLRHKFLTEGGGRMDKDLIFADDKNLINAGVLIDDGPHNIEAWSGLGIIFDAPYNQDVASDGTNVIRAYNWTQIPKLLEERL